MSRSTRSAAAAVTNTVEERRSDRRSITNYTFTYQRDRVSRRAGSSYLSIQPAGSDVPVTMTLQEAHSLYSFLSKNLDR